MYLRSIQRRNRDGSQVRYLQLAENVWDPARQCAVASVVHSFGRADQLDAEVLRRLARSLLRYLPAEEAIAAEPGVRLLGSRPLGAVHALDALWRELGLPAAIGAAARRAGSGQPLERALFAMVAHRALRPGSKRRCRLQWLPREVPLPGGERLELQHLYRAMDFLADAREEIERTLFFKTATLLDRQLDLIFYDTTSLHCEAEAEDPAPDGLRRRGHSKNGRGDAPQVVVGLAVTRDGLPVRSWVFPGNTADVATVARVRADLRAWQLDRCIFVGDAGTNSAGNRLALSAGQGRYLLASRLRADSAVAGEVLARPGRYHAVADNLRVKEVWADDGTGTPRRHVVCRNPREAARQARRRAAVLLLLRQELAALPAPGQPGHSRRACQLLASRRFRRYLRTAADGRPVLDRAAVAAEARLDGKWVVTSNDTELSTTDLALGYKQLMRVEACWRTMKSGLASRPIFHRHPRRIVAHVTLCVLALLLERVAEVRSGRPWRQIQDTLDTVAAVDYERAGARVRQTTEPSTAAADLLRKLQVPAPPRFHSIAPV